MTFFAHTQKEQYNKAVHSWGTPRNSQRKVFYPDYPPAEKILCTALQENTKNTSKCCIFPSPSHQEETSRAGEVHSVELRK